MNTNKVLLFCVFSWLGCIFGCNEEDIPLYGDQNYIQFVKDLSIDSTTIAFFYAPQATSIDSFVIVKMTGRAYSQDMEYSIVVDSNLTTMQEGIHYKLPSKTYFKATQLRDTFPVTFYKRQELQEHALRLVLRVRSNENFQQGQMEYNYKVFIAHDIISRPSWWTDEISTNYLGDYSDDKYRYFIQVNEGIDFIEISQSEIRAYALKLKYWLEEQKIATGKPITDEHGNEITVTVNG